MKQKVLDLFCGCGGMSTGLVKAGLHVVAGIDIWDKAIESYKANHPTHIAVCADLTKLGPDLFSKTYGVTEIDVLVGGPPCQSYSISGLRDKNDPRNSLFMEFCKYLDFYKPKMFMMENVIGILSMKTNSNEKIIDIIMSTFASAGYECVINKLYASDFEVPQNRRRVIIVGIRRVEGKINSNISVDKEIVFSVEGKDVNPNTSINKKIAGVGGEIGEKLIVRPVLSKDKRISVETVLEPRESVDKKYYLSEKAMQGIKAKKERSKAEGKGFGAQFLRMNEPSFTIPARYWKDGYDALVKYDEEHVRRLTILELKRIQTFPDNYILVGSKKDQIVQIGNAVACQFAYHLGLHVISVLSHLGS